MTTLKLKPVTITEEIIKSLERRKLIKSLKPSNNLARIKQGTGRVETSYVSAPDYGTHKLICVGLNSDKINLNSHSDNEEFIIINGNGHTYKPLYMVIGLYKHEVIEEKAVSNKLSANDFIALRMRYNHPATCVFTMLKDTPHCELTPKGSGRPPVFFVSEPSNLNMRFSNLGKYSLSI